MNTEQFRKFCEIAYSKAGISLKVGKEALVSARVAKRIRALDIGGISDYLEILEQDDNREELIEFLDVISTNFTSFYREPEHFQILDSYIKQWILDGQKRIRIWCTASSSGEEPYTLAMTLSEAVGDKVINGRILATDISTRMLRAANEGIYPAETIKPVKRVYLSRYFTRKGRRDDPNALYKVKPELRKKIVFKRLNLTETPFPMPGPLDAVFCRNVMIYFDKKVRTNLIMDIVRLLKPGGILMIGHTETLTGIPHGLKTIKPSIYQKPEIMH